MFVNASSLSRLLLFVFVAILAVGCRETTSRHPKNVRLTLDLEANPNHVPLFVGRSLGYFQQEGILLDILAPASTNSLQLLESGQTEFALTYLPKALRACAKRDDFCVVGKIVEKPLNGFLLLQDSGIKTHDDLNGRVVGYCSVRYSLPIFEHLLSEKNIQLGSKIHLGEDLISHLISRRIDAAYGVMQNVQPFQLEALGYKARFFSVTDFGMPEYEGLVVVASKAVRKEHNLVTGFQRALQKSIDYCRENPLIAFETYAKELQKDPSTIAWEEVSWQHTVPILANSQNFSYEKVKILADWLQEIGIMCKTVPLEPVIYSAVSE